MYDFMVFGYYAAAVGRTFFPEDSEYRIVDVVFGYLRQLAGTFGSPDAIRTRFYRIFFWIAITDLQSAAS